MAEKEADELRKRKQRRRIGLKALPGHGEVYYVGIIDFLARYHLKKKTAHFFKSHIWTDETLSTVHPQFYAERFKGYLPTIFPAPNPDDEFHLTQKSPATPGPGTSGTDKEESVSKLHALYSPLPDTQASTSSAPAPSMTPPKSTRSMTTAGTISTSTSSSTTSSAAAGTISSFAAALPLIPSFFSATPRGSPTDKKIKSPAKVTPVSQKMIRSKSATSVPTSSDFETQTPATPNRSRSLSPSVGRSRPDNTADGTPDHVLRSRSERSLS